jgi:hypothetical protein
VAALAGPAPRTEVGVAGGGGEYAYVPACSSTLHRASFWEAQAYLRHRRGGLSLSLESAHVQAQETVETPPPPGPDGAPSNAPPEITRRSAPSFLAVGRVGYHFRYGGGEVGPALTIFDTAIKHTGVLPAVRLWAGKPDVVYAWASLLAEETATASRVIGVGVGHAGERLRLSLGVGGGGGERGTAWGDGLFRLPDGPWVGAGLQIGPGRERNWGAGVRAAFEF